MKVKKAEEMGKQRKTNERKRAGQEINKVKGGEAMEGLEKLECGGKPGMAKIRKRKEVRGDESFK